MKRDWCKKRNTKKTTTACQILDVPTIDKITGLHITQVKNDGDSCVYGEPRNGCDRRRCLVLATWDKVTRKPEALVEQLLATMAAP